MGKTGGARRDRSEGRKVSNRRRCRERPVQHRERVRGMKRIAEVVHGCSVQDSSIPIIVCLASSGGGNHAERWWKRCAPR